MSLNGACLCAALLAPSVIPAQIVTYEAYAYPESDPSPWTRYGTLDAQRGLGGGLLHQVVGPDQFDGYLRTIGEFAGSPSFFLSWRETTDAPRSEISDTPNCIVAVSSNGMDRFHFTMMSDQVEFSRDSTMGLVMTEDIQPNVMHSYYLALRDDLSYTWYIDGVAVNSGQYPSAFPETGARIQWWSRFAGHEQSAKWNYIRYGVIPIDHSGDFNSNGVVDETDVYYFVACLVSPNYDAAGPACRWADMNSDGKADGADVEAFVQALVGQ